jgi:hypothetical protein
MCHTPNGRHEGSVTVPALMLTGAKTFTYIPIAKIITVSYITDAIKFKMMRNVEKL